MPGLPDITHEWAIVNYFTANCQASYPEQSPDPTETLPNSVAIVSTTVRQDLVMLMQLRSTITAVLLTANKKFTLFFIKNIRQQNTNDATTIVGKNIELLLVYRCHQYNRKLYYKKY